MNYVNAAAEAQWRADRRFREAATRAWLEGFSDQAQQRAPFRRTHGNLSTSGRCGAELDPPSGGHTHTCALRHGHAAYAALTRTVTNRHWCPCGVEWEPAAPADFDPTLAEPPNCHQPQSLEHQIALTLLSHFGGWIDNGSSSAHCQCGYVGKFGESHSRHVAAALLPIIGSRVEAAAAGIIAAELGPGNVRDQWFSELVKSIADAVCGTETPSE